MHTKHIFNIAFIALLLAALPLTALPPNPALAQGSSAMDLVNAVNAYRSANGLAPYSVDGSLMSEAQGHSDYQASIQTCTHTRADGTGAESHGVSAENIACGNNLTAEGAVYGQWTDAVHQATMIGPDTGQIGAGVAVVGQMVYYTVDVRRQTGSFVNRQPVAAGSTLPAGTQAPTYSNAMAGPISTSTPNADGSISHMVQYGETLIDIAQAYGVTVDELVGINKLDPKKPVYFAGQPLLIRLAFTPTPVLTATNTPKPPTRTPLPTRTPRPTRTATRMVTRTPVPTSTPEPMFKIPQIDDLGANRNLLAYGFIGISTLGLAALLLSSVLRGKK